MTKAVVLTLFSRWLSEGLNKLWRMYTALTDYNQEIRIILLARFSGWFQRCGNALIRRKPLIMKTRDRCDDRSSKKSWVVCNIWFKVRFSDVVVKRDQSGSFLFFPLSWLFDYRSSENETKANLQTSIVFLPKIPGLPCIVSCGFFKGMYTICRKKRRQFSNFLNKFNRYSLCPIFSQRCTTFYSSWHFLCRFKFSSHIDFDCFTFTGSTINIL